MSDKKYQVFISSTYSDLINERRKVLDILLMADCIPAGMEAFVATDIEQFEVIKKVIDLCDYYILIIGKRYGSVNHNTGISYTEMEYEYAKSKDIPVLVFAIDDSISLPDDKQDKDQKMIESLKKFREKAMSNRLTTIWKTSDELTGSLAISIMRAKSEINRPGWQRATDYDEGSLRREIMELQRKNKDLIKDLDDAKSTISSFTEQTGLAFEEHEIEIEYYYNNNRNKMKGKITVSLPELFSIIATEMMDLSINEKLIENAILRSKLFSSSNSLYLTDSQFIKRILNQYKALKLMDSFWSKEKSTLYWRLTAKGCKVRDDMILIRNT
jgi:hypothetical protein